MSAPDPSPLSLPHAWNAVADGYADEVVPIFERYAEDALRLADLPASARVLDLAAGPGTLTCLAAERGMDVVALDFAEEMLRVCRARTDGLPNVRVVEGDGQRPPFDDASFDGVFSMFGLIFFPDQSAGFREAHRVLRPGGRIVVSAWAPLDGVPLLGAMFAALGDMLPELPFGEGKAPLGRPEELANGLSEAGFRQVDVHPVTHAVEVPTVRAFWTANVRSSAPLALVRQHIPQDRWEEVGAGVVEMLERDFGTGPVDMSWPALLGVGTR